MDHADLAKIIGGGAGSFIGALLVRLGLRRAKQRGREEAILPEHQPRQVLRGEFHDLREDINKLTWRLDRVERDLGLVEGKTDSDHDRLNTAINDLSHAKDELDMVRAHCEHCPTHGPRRAG